MSRGGYTGVSTSSYTGSSFTSSFTSGSSWSGSSSSSSSSSFSGPDYSPSSSSSSSCDHKCRIGSGIAIGIIAFVCGGYLVVYAAGIVLLGMADLICQWVKKAWECPRLRLKKGTTRIKGLFLIPVWHWYGVRDQSGEKRKTVIVDGGVPALELPEGASLWARICGIAARPLQLLRNIRTPGMKEIDVEKNAIEPMSRQSHLMAHLRLLKEHPPRILPAVWKRQKTQHSASMIVQELVPTVVPLSSAKKDPVPSSDSLDKRDMKEGSIGSDRILTERPSMWRRLGSFVASFRRPQRLFSHEEDLEKDFEKDLRNHKKRGVSSLSSSPTMVGSENEKSSEMDIVKPPEPVHTPALKR